MKSTRAQPELLRLPLRHAITPESGVRRGLDRARWVALPLALGFLIAPLPLAGKVAGLVLSALGLALVLALRRRSLGPSAGGWIVVDPAGIVRHRASGDARLVSWEERFGLAIFSNESRTRGLVAITTAEHTRYVPIRAASENDLRAAALLFARSPALADSDAALAPLQADEALSAEDASRLVAAVRERDAAAIDRILLSDPRGAPIVLEGNELRAGERVIDLTAPLEWRAFLFLESAGPLGSVVQATWVRQAGVEVVLVAPQSDARDPLSRPSRLQSIPDAPPPIELRIAIERLFMAPFQHALDRAPRASRAPAPSPSTRPEGTRARAT